MMLDGGSPRRSARKRRLAGSRHTVVPGSDTAAARATRSARTGGVVAYNTRRPLEVANLRRR
jgi:hypothetical protein